MSANLEKLKQETVAADFWNNPSRAQETLKKIKQLEKQLDEWHRLEETAENAEIMLELAAEEDLSATDEKEIHQAIEEFRRVLEDYELRRLLHEPDDIRDAIMTIHPGAGGTESQDWASMLLRMYTRWLERKGFEYHMLDYQPGEEAGIKEATLEISGDYAYGYLKAENGIHRLVRISPFDANARRHTSFASVFVYPAVDEQIEIEIDPNDLRIDTYRASGAGGQHVNKTDSAVRITHIPTGIVVQCQNERSQFKNREMAMKVLKSRLYQLEQMKKQERMNKLAAQKKDIGWGNQIRSYVFQPYTMVKDHRTQYETSNIQAVMDGELDDFIKAYLLQQMEKATT